MEKSNSKIMSKYSDAEIIQSFFAAWNDGDADDIKSALYALIKRIGATHISRETGIPRTTLYDMCKDESNPTLENLCLIIDFLKMQKVA
jgi:probable addiction module antidote protein